MRLPTRPFGALLLLVAVLAMMSVPGPARAALFGREGLDPAFCKTQAVRQTVLYIDDRMMVDGQTAWARKLADKLRATLAPGERLTVVRLETGTGQSGELWSGCWPGYTERQRAALEKRSFLFSRDPLSTLSDQRKYFLGAMGSALTTIYAQAKRPADAARIDASNPPRKQIIRALASDEGRFSASQVTIRAIIYSDMAENSDLGSVFQSGSAPTDLGQKLGTYLRGGVFYAFGVEADVSGDPDFPEVARRFWLTALRGMAATLGGMGADLNVPNLLPVAAHTYAVALTMDNQPLEGRLSLLTDADGALVDSWIGISRLGSAGLGGTFICEAGGTCRLDATTSSGLATNAPNERVVLRGPPQGPLAGNLGVRAQGLTFKLRTEDVR